MCRQRTCDLCDDDALPGERYCRGHKVIMVDRMHRDGYFTPDVRIGSSACGRGPAHREAVEQTKFGYEPSELSECQ